MITEQLEFRLDKMLSIRKKILQNDLQETMDEIKKICRTNNLDVKSITTVNYGISREGNGQIFIDLEILIVIEKIFNIEKIPKGYSIKEDIIINKVLHNHHEGSNQNVIKVFNELQQYIKDKNIQPLTPLYVVSQDPYNQPENYSILDIYVGIK